MLTGLFCILPCTDEYRKLLACQFDLWHKIQILKRSVPLSGPISGSTSGSKLYHLYKCSHTLDTERKGTLL